MLSPAEVMSGLLSRRRGEAEGSRALTRLRLLAIVAPLVFLTVVASLVRGVLHEQLHSFPGFLYLLLVLAAGVSLFSFAIFGLIGRLEQEILERNRQLEALLAVGQAASSSLHLADVLDAALDAILDVTSAEAAEVWLLEDEELLLERQRGLGAEAFRERTRFPLGEGLPGVAAASGEPVVVHDLASDPRFLRRQVTELGYQSFCALPLRRRGEIVGVLGVAARRREALAGQAEHRLLEGIGEQLAVAIENARLHRRVLDDAVLEERERLARELHDGLAQVLGYVNTQTLAIKRLLASGRTSAAEAHVAEMETTAKGAYTDVREAILGLRPRQAGLLESVRSSVADFARMTGIAVHVEVSGGAETMTLPPTAEIQLARIVQEALSNVRKHAHATEATVTIETAGGELAVEVADDGRGFDAETPRRTGWPHFGLQTMRERAEAVGGRLEIDSTPGRGTRITMRVPLPLSAEVPYAGAAR
jgi:signal transduction histidine kinase